MKRFLFNVTIVINNVIGMFDFNRGVDEAKKNY